MGVRSEQRRHARELKEKGVPFLERVKMAKKLARGKSMLEALREVGFQLVSQRGCECCDPASYCTWKLGKLKVETSFGYLEWVEKEATV